MEKGALMNRIRQDAEGGGRRLNYFLNLHCEKRKSFHVVRTHVSQEIHLNSIVNIPFLSFAAYSLLLSYRMLTLQIF